MQLHFINSTNVIVMYNVYICILKPEFHTAKLGLLKTRSSMPLKNKYSLIIILLLLACIYGTSEAQNKIKGIVTDSITGEPLPFISVSLKGNTVGAMTDNSGKFSLSVPNSARILISSSIGYKQKSTHFEYPKNTYLRIRLAPASYKISEVVVKPGKRKYKKKGNPAVEFVQKVIDSKNQHSPYNKAYYHYQHDEKIDIALNNFRKEKNKRLLHKYSFLINYVDTSTLSGKPILAVSSKEIIEDYYFQKSPRIEKKVVTAKRNSGIEQFLPEDGVNQFLGEIFKDVDIYDNNITLFLKPFVSPLSTGGPDFYKYYLMDTLQIDGERCADLGFVPFSSQSPGFTGHLYITLDSTYFVKKIKLNFPKDINLNYIQDMSIEQEFNRASDGTRLLMFDDIKVEFAILSKSNGFYARRTNRYSQHSFDSPADKTIFKQQENIIEAKDVNKPDSFWVKNQFNSGDTNGKSVGSMLERLRQDPFYYYFEKTFGILVTGYIETAPQNNKITLGPIYSTISSNTAEGERTRLGGFTTANLNSHWFADGYLAYGTKDKKVKYLAELEYSFDKKKKLANEFPIHSIRASYGYDLNRLGQYYNTAADNVLLSFKRQSDDRITYQRKMQLSYNQEFYSQLSYGVDLRYRTEFATQYLPFTDNSTLANIPSFSIGEAAFRLRYAPGERIYQTPGKRFSITRNAPVFTLSHTVAMKGILGSDYNYSHTELGFKKRFWFSALSNANVIIKTGKVWSKNPYPLLILPNANLSYTVQYESFCMMNATEFINNQYVSWDLNYNMNGLILNRVPLIQYLKLREILSFRGMYGSLNNKNNPAYSSGLFQFPTGSYTMGKTPYMEAGIGIENIFKVLRIDYVWRMTYLDHPNIDKTGIRFALDVAF